MDRPAAKARAGNGSSLRQVGQTIHEPRNLPSAPCFRLIGANIATCGFGRSRNRLMLLEARLAKQKAVWTLSGQTAWHRVPTPAGMSP